MSLTPDMVGLKLATKAMIEAGGGGLACAKHTRIGKSQLSEAASRDHPDTFLPLDALFDLEIRTAGATGFPHVLRYLAAHLGYALVRLPDTEASSGDLMRLVGDAADKAGNLVGAICKALADGRKPNASEAAEMIATLDRKMECHAALRASLVAIQRGE